MYCSFWCCKQLSSMRARRAGYLDAAGGSTDSPMENSGRFLDFLSILTHFLGLSCPVFFVFLLQAAFYHESPRASYGIAAGGFFLLMIKYGKTL